jgi:hypothetical protein
MAATEGGGDDGDGTSGIDGGGGNGGGSGNGGVGTDGKDGGNGNDIRRELWRIISGSEVRFMWNITTWTPIHGRLGNRRLGTVIPCISFVD